MCFQELRTAIARSVHRIVEESVLEASDLYQCAFGVSIAENISASTLQYWKGSEVDRCESHAGVLNVRVPVLSLEYAGLYTSAASIAKVGMHNWR
jgi:hypothetical protein